MDPLHAKSTWKGQRPRARGRRGRLDRFLVRVVDGGLAGTVCVLPFFFGGRSALGQFLLVALALAVALAWTVRQLLQPEAGWRRSGAAWLLAAGVVLLALQATPLPASWLDRLAPRSADLLPLWQPDAPASAALGTWSTLSLTPAATRTGLVIFLAYALLFLVALQRLRSIEHVERVLRWCALAAVIMAAFGLVQYLTSNGKFFWFYDHPYSSTSDAAKGGFTNRNHFAHFLALGVGPLLWWTQRSRRGRGRRPETVAWSVRSGDPAATWGVLGLGIILFAVLLSLSRGGAVVAVVSTAMFGLVGLRAGAVRWRLMAGVGAAALLVLAGLAVFGSDRVAERLSDLTADPEALLEKQEGRRTIWETTLKAIPDFAILGAGVGSFQHVYPMYLPWRANRFYYTHAENGYLQVTLETGGVGLALLLAGMALCATWCLRGLRRSASQRAMACSGAISASLAVSAVHSLFDFVWYVPAVMATVAVLAAAACRLAQLAQPAAEAERRRDLVPVPRLAWAAATLLILAAGTWMLRDRIGPVMAASHWQRVRMLLEMGGVEAVPDGQSESAEPDGLAQTAPPEDAGRREADLVAELEQVVRWDPDHPGAHLQLAEAYLQLFDRLQEDSVNQMPLSQIKEAALRAQPTFDGPKAYLPWLATWLDRAVGDHHRYLRRALEETRHGLALCPLQGEGYLFLAELGFLEGGTEQTTSAYIDQALAVRPYDGAVLFHAGKEALLNGDLAGWQQYWKRSYQSGRVCQQDLIDHLVGRLGPERLDDEIRFILQTFQPDLWALRYMYYRYRRIAEPEQLTRLRLAYAQAAEAEAARRSGPEAARCWLEAMSVWTDPEQIDRRVRCGLEAVAASPNDYDARYRLAVALAEAGRLAEAEKHFRWCLARRPGNRALEKKFRQLIRERMAPHRQMTARTETNTRF